MRFPSFVFGGASFGRDRRDARPAGRARRRHNATHRLGGEMLEGRAVLAVMVPAPTVTAVTAVTDSGSSVVRTGGATNAETLTITGTVAPGATTVTVFNGNISLGPATIAESGRTWSFTTAAPLVDGIYNFRARATVGTATSAASARPFVVTVDTAAPAAPTISSVLDDRAPFVGTVPRGGVTNDRTLTLTGTAEPGSRVEVFAGSTSLGIATLVGSTWRLTTKPLTIDGDYEFTARATDRAGNTSAATDPYRVTVDTKTTTAINSIVDDEGTIRGDLLSEDLKYLRGITNDTTLELIGTAEPGSRVEIFGGSTSLGLAKFDTPESSTWRFRTERPMTEPPMTDLPKTKPNLPTTKPLTNGQTYRFTARATDRAGNMGVSEQVIPILIDTTAPWRPLITVANDGSKDVADRGVTNKTSLTISGQAEGRQRINVPGSDPIIVPGCRVEVFDRDTSTNPVTDRLVGTVDEVDVGGFWSIDVSGLVEGTHRFYVRTTDAAGNTSVLPSVNYTVTVDLTAPSIPTIAAAIDGVEPGLGVVTGPTNETRPLLTGTTELGSVVKIYDGTLSPATFLGFAAVTGTTWTFRPPSPLSEGTHLLLATATDSAGNESSADTYEITVDTTPAQFLDFGTDPTEPTDGSYECGEIVYIDLVFDEPLFVDTTDGTPRIRVNTEPARYATYDSGSGTDTLRFKYEPQLGDKTNGSLDVDPAVIDLDGGTIRDAAGNDANPSLGSLAARKIKVDAKLTILDPTSPPNARPLPFLTRHRDGKIPTDLPDPVFLANIKNDHRRQVSQITLKFNAPLKNGLTNRSFDLLFEDRSMSTEGVIIEQLADNQYRLTLPPATHQSLSGYYRLVIGRFSEQESDIVSGEVVMEEAVALHWYMPPSA